jgi:hypothetical protein
MLNKKIIGKALLRLSLHYVEAAHTPQTIAVLAEDWAESLGQYYVSAADFTYCMSKIRMRCRFFPKIFDFIQILEEYRRSYEYDKHSNLALPEQGPKTEHDCQINRQCVAVLARVVAGEIAWQAGEQMCCAIINGSAKSPKDKISA